VQKCVLPGYFNSSLNIQGVSNINTQSLFAYSGIQAELGPRDIYSRAQTEFDISCEHLIRKVKGLLVSILQDARSNAVSFLCLGLKSFLKNNMKVDCAKEILPLSI
jgi:hypothetical protein